MVVSEDSLDSEKPKCNNSPHKAEKFSISYDQIFLVYTPWHTQTTIKGNYVITLLPWFSSVV